VAAGAAKQRRLSPATTWLLSSLSWLHARVTAVSSGPRIWRLALLSAIATSQARGIGPVRML
jgi:hypothetical protein